MEFEHSSASAAWKLRLVESYARGREGIDRQTDDDPSAITNPFHLPAAPRKKNRPSTADAVVGNGRNNNRRALHLSPPPTHPHTHTRTHARTLQYILRPAAVAQLGGRCRGSSCSPQAQAASAKICTTGEHRKRQSLPNEPKVAYRSKLLPFWLPARFGTSYSIA